MDACDGCCCICICISCLTSSICTYFPASWCPCCKPRSKDDDAFVDSVEQENFYHQNQHGTSQHRTYNTEEREAHGQMLGFVGPRGQQGQQNGHGHHRPSRSQGDGRRGEYPMNGHGEENGHGRRPSGPPAYGHERARSGGHADAGMTYPPTKEMKIPAVPLVQNGEADLPNPYGGFEGEEGGGRQQQQQRHERSQSRPDETRVEGHVREKSVN